LTVLNKADLLGLEDGRRKVDEEMTPVPEWAADAIVVSAAKGWGLDGLRERIEEALAEAAEDERRQQMAEADDRKRARASAIEALPETER